MASGSRESVTTWGELQSAQGPEPAAPDWPTAELPRLSVRDERAETPSEIRSVAPYPDSNREGSPERLQMVWAWSWDGDENMELPDQKARRQPDLLGAGFPFPRSHHFHWPQSRHLASLTNPERRTSGGADSIELCLCTHGRATPESNGDSPSPVAANHRAGPIGWWDDLSVCRENPGDCS